MTPRHWKLYVLVSLPFAVLIKPAPAMVSISPADEVSFNQEAGPASTASVRLLKSTARFSPTEATFTITTEAECSLSLFHVYLDTDMDASTGYQPPSRKPDAMGADYLIEGSNFHQWDGGGDHSVWKWKQLDSVKVERGAAGEIRVTVPLARLAPRQPGRLRALIETLSDNWASVDTLPRAGIWMIDLTGAKKPSSAPPSAQTQTDSTGTVASNGAVLIQAGNPSMDKAASLLQASAALDKSQLIVSIRTEGAPNRGLFHIYIDTDLDFTTGFHPETAAEGLGGADFLVEGDFLYAWGGGQNHGAWQWQKISPVTVSGDGPGQFKVAIPLDKLMISDGKRIQLLVETINDKWQGQDTLPRKGVWRVDLLHDP